MPDPTAVQLARMKAKLDEGEVFAAYDLARRLLRNRPKDPEVERQLLELRLRAEDRLDLDDQIDNTLARLDAIAPDSEELHGYRGKLYRRRALRAQGPEREALLRRSLAAYKRGHRPKRFWLGINVATVAHLLGEKRAARKAARAVQAAVEEMLRAKAVESVEYLWLLGTMGDASLIRQEVDKALRHYGQLRAGAVEQAAWNVLASVRRNSSLILSIDSDRPTRERVRNALRPPGLVMCVGHMVDQGRRERPRFPATSQDAVAKALAAYLDADDLCGGVSSLACGADTLFQEALAARGVRRHVVLPFPAEDFRRTSVPEDWAPRFAALLEADRQSQAMPYPLDAHGLEFEFCNRFIEGLAQIHADQLGAAVKRVAVWDGQPGDGRGGTADVVKMWRSHPAEPYSVIDPRTAVIRHESADLTATPKRIRNRAGDFVIGALLFADAVGYSGLNERQVRAFVDVFLTGLSEIAKRPAYREHTLECNTWGDAVFLAMDDVALAGRLALDLRDHVRAPAQRAAFREHGLPDRLALRIALHAAVLRCMTDPFTDIQRVAGAQISHAARIEPITPVGEVYASDTFAALSRADGAQGFRCQYVGRTVLAKNFGTFPTYHVRRDGPAPA